MQNNTHHTARSAYQPPIHAPQYCVLYIKEGKEHRTPWFSHSRAQKALTIMQAKYGKQKAIIYRD